MAETRAGDLLTQAYRVEAKRLGEDAAIEAASIVAKLLDPANVAGTQRATQAAVEAVVQEAYDLTARAAVSYLAAFGQVEGGRPIEAAPASLDPDLFAARFRASGPAHLVGMLGSGHGPTEARRGAAAQVAGAVARTSTDGGRDTSANVLEESDHWDGWRRVGTGSTCKFCRMLIGRGAVYQASTARFASHEHCNCSAEPARGGTPLTVAQYTATKRKLTEADRNRLREYLGQPSDSLARQMEETITPPDPRKLYPYTLSIAQARAELARIEAIIADPEAAERRASETLRKLGRPTTGRVPIDLAYQRRQADRLRARINNP